MIFCVEDDINIRELVVYTLQSTGFDAVGVSDGTQLFEKLKENHAELIILDIMLPGEDGITILKKLRASSSFADIPVIMATAKGSEYDKVIGLDLGADDYVTKPFGMMELVSRIKAVLRRTGRSAVSSASDIITCGGITMKLEQHQVFVNGREVVLTFKEFELLKALMEQPKAVLTRDKLLNTVWGYDFSGETRTVDVHVRTLRQKLAECSDLIETVRGVGYRIGDGK